MNVAFCFRAFVLLTLVASPILAAGASKAPKGGKAKKAAAPAPRFRVQQLHLDNNEGCAVGDFNRDGKPDVSAGEFWYPGPAFTEKKPLRHLESFQADYLTNNGEHAFDVNGDGWPDIVSGSFMDPKLYWYENPRADGLQRGDLWKQHLLIDTGLAQNEWTDLRDIDGDGTPELVVNSWGESNAAMLYRFAKNENGEPILKPWTIQPGGTGVNGHGIGYGDINGDGLEDIVFGGGWYERPKTGATTQPWIRHADWKFPHASTPMLVLDLTGDGRADIIWGHGHNYGLYWEERRDDNRDGSTNWRHFTIDDKVSQNHCLVWEDIDNDGAPELITGRRVKAHSGNDPGDSEPGCVVAYKWNKATRTFAKLILAQNGPGIGLQIRVADLDGNGWKDIVVAGKSGTHILWNEGK
jgi:hypothetical protein